MLFYSYITRSIKTLIIFHDDFSCIIIFSCIVLLSVCIGMSLRRQRPGVVDDTQSEIDSNTSYSNTYYEEDFSSLEDSSLDEGMC